MSASPPNSAVRNKIIEISRDMISEGSADTVAGINFGLCADLADAAQRELAEKHPPVGVEILSVAGLCTELPPSEAPTSIGPFDPTLMAPYPELQPPPWTNWEFLECVGANTQISHCWIAFEGRHYDAEHPDGVTNPFDLNCVRHALAELVEIHSATLYHQLVATDPWWRETNEIRSQRETPLALTP